MVWYHAVSSKLTKRVETKEIIACLFVFSKECQKAVKIVGVTASMISIWAGPALGFTGPYAGSIHDDPYSPMSLWLFWALWPSIAANLQDPVHLRQEVDAQHYVMTKGRYESIWVSIGLPRNCCLGWQLYIWHPHHIFLQTCWNLMNSALI